MNQLTRRFTALASLLVIINIIGLIWIRNDLTRSRKQVVRIASIRLSPDVLNPERLILLFDRQVIDYGLVGKDEQKQLFTIEPSLAGSWRWSGLDTLEYDFNSPPPPGRIYQIHPTDEFQVRTGKVIGDDKNLRFETISLEFKEFRVLAADDRDVTIELVFNQPVEPDDLLRYTSFYDDKSSAVLGNVVCLTKKPEEKMVVRLRRPGSNRLRIVLSEKLTGYEAELSLKNKVEHKLEIPTSFSLLSTHLQPPGLEEIIPVYLEFSQAINTEQEIPKITIEPIVEDVKIRRNYRTLQISGRFEPGGDYTIKIPGTLLASDSHPLGKERSVKVKIPDRRARIAFAQNSGLLSPLGKLELDLKTTNVEEIELKSWRVYQNNLASHLRGEGIDSTSRFLFNKKAKIAMSYNKIQKLSVGLQDLVQGEKGIYHIEARAANRKWTQDSTIVVITDLAITAKLERDGALVWVTSLKTGKPQSGVQINGLTYNNQMLASAETDAAGVAKLKYSSNGPNGDLWIIIAEKDGDLSYLNPNNEQWVISDVDQSGRAYAENYEVMLYPERGVYRPGDTIYLTAILRGRTGQIPPTFPLSIQIIRPDGKQINELLAKPQENGQGIFQTEYATRSDGQTGCYQFEAVLPGSKQILGWCEVFVEAFVPLRMEVKAEPTAKRFGPNDLPEIQVSGRYLWDQPAADLTVKIEGDLRNIKFKSEKFPDFCFGTLEKEISVSIPSINGQLDNSGKGKMTIKVPSKTTPDIYQISLSATVTETGGRSVSNNTSAILDLLNCHIGLHLTGGQVVEVNQPIKAEWVCLTGEDKPVVAGDMELKLVSVEYDTVLKEVDGRQVWESVEKLEEIKKEQISSSSESRGSFEVNCPSAGMYRIIAKNNKTGSITHLNFYASEEKSSFQSLAMNQPEKLEIVTDKQMYLPGETAQVLVRSPFAGTLLITLETDNVVDYQTAEITKNTVELKVPIGKELRGGAYITATVVRAIDTAQTSWLPHRAMGITKIIFDHSSQTIPVKISSPQKIQPGETPTITIETGIPTDSNHPAIVHIWAVDEGILLTSEYQTPDPMNFFFGPRRLGVDSSDIFYQLLADYERPVGIARIGADEDYKRQRAMASRRSTIPARQRQAAVVWRKATAVDPNGKVTIDMNMPDLIGQMRLMAVAVANERYGSAEHDLIITSPLIVETSWPRFAAPGDEFKVPVKLFNSTDSDLFVRLKTKITGQIEISSGLIPDEIVVKPKDPVTYFLSVKATAVGQADVQVESEETRAVDKPLRAVSKGLISIRPATALHSEVQIKTITAGEELKIEPSKSFIEGTMQMTINIGPKPSVQLGAAMEDLIGYPYGCIEQTTSKLFALLYAADVLQDKDSEAINSMVQAGIARLWSMQNLSGGLSYWPGDSEPSEWGTAYAAWCLMEARSAGHKVDERFSKELMKYIESRLNSDSEEENNLNNKALFCHVLSAFGQPPHGWMNLLFEHKNRLDTAALAHLSSAFFAAGNKAKSLAILAEDLPSTSVETVTKGQLTSQVHQEAVLLSTLLEIDPNNPMTALLASSLMKAMQNGHWASTLENAAAIVALSRYQIITEKEQSDFSGSIRANQGQDIHFDHTKQVSCHLANVAKPIVISSSGTGKIYAVFTTEGLAVEGVVKPYSRQMTVQRRWLNKEGKVIDANILHVGDLVQVEVEISSTNGTSADNIAIVDALAGGMEIENPHLATSASAGQQKGNEPDHVEFLDDRVVLFCSINSEKSIFRYSLRVTTAGHFDLPPVQSSCMYDPAFAFMGKSGEVKIQE